MTTAINVNSDWTVGDLIDFEFASRNRTRPALRRYQPAIETRGHLLASNGWKIEREKVIVGHAAWRFRRLGRKTLRQRILPDDNDLIERVFYGPVA